MAELIIYIPLIGAVSYMVYYIRETMLYGESEKKRCDDCAVKKIISDKPNID